MRTYLKEEVAPALRALDIRVTSSWIYDPPENDAIAQYLRDKRAGLLPIAHNAHYEHILRHEAMRDVLDVRESDTIMRFPAQPGMTASGSGKFTEYGIAIGRNMRIITIGTRETVFDYLDQVEVYPTFDALLEALRSE